MFKNNTNKQSIVSEESNINKKSEKERGKSQPAVYQNHKKSVKISQALKETDLRLILMSLKSKKRKFQNKH
jgi:ABC-type uncharacterized transport system ATPase component